MRKFLFYFLIILLFLIPNFMIISIYEDCYSNACFQLYKKSIDNPSFNDNYVKGNISPLVFMFLSFLNLFFSSSTVINLMYIILPVFFFLSFYYLTKDYFDLKTIILMVSFIGFSRIWFGYWTDLWRELLMISFMFMFLKFLLIGKYKYSGIALGLMSLSHVTFFLMYPFLIIYSLIKKSYKKVLIVILVSFIIVLSNLSFYSLSFYYLRRVFPFDNFRVSYILLELASSGIQIQGNHFILNYIYVLISIISFFFYRKNKNYEIFYALFLGLLSVSFLHERIFRQLFFPIMLLNGVFFNELMRGDENEKKR